VDVAQAIADLGGDEHDTLVTERLALLFHSVDVF
jgi:hypothetical protein